MIESPCQGLSKSRIRHPQSCLGCPISTSFILQSCFGNSQTSFRDPQSTLVADQSGLRGPQSTFSRDPSCLFRADNTCLVDILSLNRRFGCARLGGCEVFQSNKYLYRLGKLGGSLGPYVRAKSASVNHRFDHCQGVDIRLEAQNRTAQVGGCLSVLDAGTGPFPVV